MGQLSSLLPFVVLFDSPVVGLLSTLDFVVFLKKMIKSFSVLLPVIY